MAQITPESPNLTDYLYDWAYEEERDFYPVGMESQVMLVYSTRDTLAECMEGFMNSDYQETYALTPVTYRFLTPETDWAGWRLPCLSPMSSWTPWWNPIRMTGGTCRTGKSPPTCCGVIPVRGTRGISGTILRENGRCSLPEA